MGETVEVSTGTLLTVGTGKMLVNSFSDVHRAADVLLGHPLMTHQFASERVEKALQREARRQHPWLADPTLLDDFPDLRGGGQVEKERLCRAWVAAQSAKHGERHTLVSPPEPWPVPFAEGLPAKFGGKR